MTYSAKRSTGLTPGGGRTGKIYPDPHRHGCMDVSVHASSLVLDGRVREDRCWVGVRLAWTATYVEGEDRDVVKVV